MSNALQTMELLTAISAAVVRGLGPITVDYDDPPRLPREPPYALVLWKPVEISFDGPGASASMMAQTNTFEVRWIKAMPADPAERITPLKIADANAIIAQLQAASRFAGIGFLPLVIGVDPGESYSPTEPVYEGCLTFRVQTVANHH